jgi:predicted component of type VI protein secretion system
MDAAVPKCPRVRGLASSTNHRARGCSDSRYPKEVGSFPAFPGLRYVASLQQDPVIVIQVILKDPRSGTEQKYDFDQSPIRIGRNPLNNVVLEGNFVSGWHGIIRFDNTGTYYYDLGSTNGTCLDGKRLPKNTPVPISRTTRLTIWMFELVVSPAVPGTAGAVQQPPSRAWPVDTLVGTGRSTEVFSTPPAALATTPQNISQSQISPSRIVSAGGSRAPTPATPTSATPRHPSQVALSPAVGEPTPERLVRCLRIIGAFADAFMGLKKGYEQFGSEVGVRPLTGTTRLHRARTSQEIIEYVLDPAMDPEACARDLNAVFADMGIHDLALIEGISQSVRSLLAKLDPSTLDVKAGASLWSGSKNKAKWTSYVEAFNNLLSEDAALHTEIFGEEFASGYASVARGSNDTDPDSE